MWTGKDWNAMEMRWGFVTISRELIEGIVHLWKVMLKFCKVFSRVMLVKYSALTIVPMSIFSL